MSGFFTNREQRLKNVANGYIRRGKLRGLNKTCKWMPCHKTGLQDCSFCVCPFYPCKDEQLGKWYYFNKEGIPNRVWDCTGCSLNHRKDLAAELITDIKDVADHQGNMSLFLKYKEKYLKLINRT